MSTVELGSWNGLGTSAVLTLHGKEGEDIVARMTPSMRWQLLMQLQSVVRSCTPTNQLPSDETMGRVRRGSLPATSAMEADLSLYVPQADDDDNDIAEEHEEIIITWPDTGDEGDEGEPQWQARKASPQETPSGAFVASLLGLPNTKSAGHPETCRPCVFFWRRRCSQGEDCPFCHEEDHEQRFKAERAERNRRRPGLRIRRGL
eukprot:TRINITY_DN3210_c0_g1_i3.p1 TRINITY_DN3210_c0_g1~~TRINITY_DN3210_c0_g1_i3.p1  ORF type:complete len:218 (-),score=27.52 TRINITY_DN3210_c0_g1_i3:218-829(-)